MFEHEMEESKKVSLFIYFYFLPFYLSFGLIILQKLILLVRHYQRGPHIYVHAQLVVFHVSVFPDVSFLQCLLASKYISYRT